MEILLDRNENFTDVNRIRITSSEGIEYRVQECKHSKGLIINKITDFGNDALNIQPNGGVNEIKIK